MHIPKEKKQRLDKRFWQRIFVGYEDKNQYQIFNSQIKKLHVARDVKIDEYNFYDNLAINPWELADKNWSSSNDVVFADLNKFEKKLDDQPRILEKNLLQSGMGKKSYKPIEEVTPAENVRNNSDLVFNSILDYMDFLDDKPGLST